MNFAQFLEFKGFEKSKNDPYQYYFPSESEFDKQLENAQSDDLDRQLEAEAWVEKYPIMYHWNNDPDTFPPTYDKAELTWYNQYIDKEEKVIDSDTYGFIEIPVSLLT
jgi:hypothetical protein|tara:strand:- start:816 stop:1139 length:324 start_codon:yes stop_codon:yes gene_type:complete